MARINLLPWRADRRKLREREFYMLLLASAIGGIVALLALVGWMGARIDNQNERNTYLQNEIKGLDKQIEEIKELDKTRSQLLTRKQIIEQLQSNRSQMVHLFDEMVKTIPDGVRLTSMKQAGDVLTLEGVAESNARVASYMRSIDNSPWMGRTDLRKIENKTGTRDADKKAPYVFSLDVKLRKPEDAQKENQVAEGGEAAEPAGATTASAAAPAAASGAATPPAGEPAPVVATAKAPPAAAVGTAPAATPAAAPPAPAPAQPAKDAEKGEKK
ncbi:MAG TPA: PilN domain-containing protein [Rhodanobacteraceae bacterium]|nr:PilN domain-containing protein [Rhodanobacteraceae bacterium]